MALNLFPSPRSLTFFPMTPQKRRKRWGGPQTFYTLGVTSVGEDSKGVENFQKKGTRCRRKGKRPWLGECMWALCVKMPVCVSLSPNLVWVCMSFLFYHKETYVMLIIIVILDYNHMAAILGVWKPSVLTKKILVYPSPCGWVIIRNVLNQMKTPVFPVVLLRKQGVTHSLTIFLTLPH